MKVKIKIFSDKQKLKELITSRYTRNTKGISSDSEENNLKWKSGSAGKNEEYQKILGTKKVCPLSPLLFNAALEVVASTMKQEKELKA